MKLRIFVLVAVAALASLTSRADALTYDVNRIVGANGSVVGTITTDGFLGSWGTTNHIVDWSLQITDALGSFLLTGPSSGNSSALDFQSSGLSSSLATINFDFGTTGYLLFQPSLFSGLNFWCLQSSVQCALVPATEVLRTGHFGEIQQSALSGDQIIATRDVGQTPIPGALPLFASGLGIVGYMAMRRRRRAA